MTNKLIGRLVNLAHTQIEVGVRARKDFSADDLEDLGNDLAKNGFINPITVLDKKAAGIEAGDESHRQYLLLAGARRYRASLMWKQRFYQENPDGAPPDHMKKIPCHVFDWPLSPQEMKIIELHENVKRKDFTAQERALLTKEIHEALTEIQYKEDSKVPHTMESTADFLNVSRGTISQDIAIADALQGEDEVLKERVLAAGTKKKAIKEIAARKKALVVAEISRRNAARAEKGVSDRRVALCRSYIHGRFEEEILKVGDRTVDFVELDPDYGIDFKSSGRGGERESARDYEEVAPEVYEEELRSYAKQAYRVMKDNSWGLVWFSIMWYKETLEILRDEGFMVPELPIFWDKVEGNTTTPAYRLNNRLEFCFYIRKGVPRMAVMGRDNLISMRRPHSNERDHAAEKPIELYEAIYDTFLTPGSHILVGFAGSGNAILAASNLGHIARGFDSIKANKEKFDAKVLTWNKGPFKTYTPIRPSEKTGEGS